MAGQHFLVTGGAGFVGSNLVDTLLKSGHRVTVLDDLSVGKMRNIAHHLANPSFRFIKGSVLDVPLVERLMSGVDAVYHLAAVVGVKYVVDDPLRGMLVNVNGTENILKAALKYQRKVLVTSSSEVFGRPVNVPLSENDATVLGPTSVPRWSYAVSKLLDEHLAFAYNKQQQLPTVVVRYFNAYGPRLDPLGYGSVIAKFITQALSGKPLTVHGDGSQTRSFTFVGDTVRGTMAAMDTPEAEGLAFNIGNRRECTINQLAGWVRDAFDGAVEIEHIPYEQAYGKNFEDTKRRCPDISRAREVLGFEAQVPLEDGLRRTILWFKEHRDELIPA
ncbi:MAG: GDP-mannose 4,6-dehydratase [Anaerolineae bacterium]|nr:GDP-mannose 4,6-dehydratase [Anaerolineae bacterium]